ncbi:cytochrome c3 family protein [Rhodopirellula sp. MGV]|uniref:cytochrome c3 family protein n=1 Tax=Rhodopirellula sp. MGV TaxID=2023130 RepID=UPI000B96C3F1|nr:cytochrome c3 family protein [Rhodopirellula sp. MGV]OYP30442.1 hypothetical protein CGZ80_22605 [Rhodopirellula sp. MGV]PNY34787.1 hypothetical protein C2E31_21285 [Rhodopirellula baltica]
MRENEIAIPEPPADDRPNDRWQVDVDQQRLLTWNGRRRRWFWGGSVGTLALCLSSMLLIPPTTMIKPGKLAAPHAQILSGSVGKERCGACHDGASLGIANWFSGATIGHAGVKQTELCLNCHHRTISPNLARSAHNLPASVRNQLSEAFRESAKKRGDNQGAFSLASARKSIDQDNLECNVCHQEHHGIEGTLLAITDQQCQACHTIQFGSFAESHPQWDEWPYGRGGSLAFSHATHEGTHFPGWKNGAVAFDCNRCHPDRKAIAGLQANRQGELLRTVAFETGCASCHDESMSVASASGIAVLAIPIIEADVAASIPDWPTSAIGFTDGKISPLMELLLRADPVVAEALHQVPDGDLSRLPPGTPKSKAITKTIAEATATLMSEISTDGHQALLRRLGIVGGGTLPVQSILRTLPPQLIQSARERWFAQNQVTVNSMPALRLVAAGEDDLLGDDLLSGSLLDEQSDDALLDDSLLGDPLLGDPLLEGDAVDPLKPPEPGHSQSERLPASFDATRLAQAGGWYRDDLTMTIRYRGSGHTDPVMQGLIEMFSGLSDADQLKKRFMGLGSVDACVRCHEGAVRLPASWEAHPTIGGKRDFTKFSHRPHLNVSELGQCTYCHEVAKIDSESASTEAHQQVDFNPLGQQKCAACHTAQAASDRCTTCHRYHIEH